MENPDIEPYSSYFPVLLEAIIKSVTPDMVLGLVLIMVLLLLSGLISGSEIAFFSLNPTQIAALKTKPDARSKAIIYLLEIPKRLLATILISNNFINVSIVILSTFVTTAMFNFEAIAPWLAFLIQVVIITGLIIFIGEILPKVYATQRNEQFARFMAVPVKVILRLIYPLSSVLMKSTTLIDKVAARRNLNISMSELSDAIELTADESTSEEDRKILKGIVKFGDIDVKEIMKARLDVVAVDMKTNFKDLLKIIIDSGYSRIPVFEESFDNIKGILYVKDLLLHLDEDEDFKWRAMLRDAFFVPENKMINDLLHEFQQKKIHLAIVVDEYGGTSGIVTLEDIIEEIVGEITDEHDVSSKEVIYTKIDDHTYVFEGKTSLNDFCKIVGIEDKIFENIKGESDSLAGLLLEQIGKIPDKGERVGIREFVFIVKAVDKRRIKSIVVKIRNPENDAGLNEITP